MNIGVGVTVKTLMENNNKMGRTNYLPLLSQLADEGEPYVYL